MGQVVRFDRRRRTVSARRGFRPEGQILMFTGVRYDKPHGGSSSSPGTGVKAKHKRG